MLYFKEYETTSNNCHCKLSRLTKSTSLFDNDDIDAMCCIASRKIETSRFLPKYVDLILSQISIQSCMARKDFAGMRNVRKYINNLQES